MDLRLIDQLWTLARSCCNGLLVPENHLGSKGAPASSWHNSMQSMLHISCRQGASLGRWAYAAVGGAKAGRGMEDMGLNIGGSTRWCLGSGGSSA